MAELRPLGTDGARAMRLIGIELRYAPVGWAREEELAMLPMNVVIPAGDSIVPSSARMRCTLHTSRGDVDFLLPIDALGG